MSINIASLIISDCNGQVIMIGLEPCRPPTTLVIKPIVQERGLIGGYWIMGFSNDCQLLKAQKTHFSVAIFRGDLYIYSVEFIPRSRIRNPEPGTRSGQSWILNTEQIES